MSEDSRNPFLNGLYQRYLDDQDSSAFIDAVSKRYSQGTLQRLADHPQGEVRRGAILALGFIGDYEVNHTVGRALHDKDRTVRILAENGIRNVWTRVGSEKQRRLLVLITRLVAGHQYHEALVRATELIEDSRWFSEAWNQRATAYFRIGRFTESIRDSHQTLEINPYHFDAAVSMGQAYLELDNQVSALESFRRALRLNPNLEGVRVQIDRLSRSIEGR